MLQSGSFICVHIYSCFTKFSKTTLLACVVDFMSKVYIIDVFESIVNALSVVFWYNMFIKTFNMLKRMYEQVSISFAS